MAVPFSVCVFCGSRVGRNPAFIAAAAELGGGLGARGWRLVYGGGEVGLMGVVANAVLAAGGQALGLIPRRLLDREVGKRDLTELQVTETMFERKERMIAQSDAFVCLPGGLGTLDELLEVLTLRQLGYHDKPIVLTDVAGYWNSCGALLDQVIAQGFADPSVRTLLALVPSVAVTLELLEAQRRGSGATTGG
ncbi:MAG TPA: TIGR00730 family Rossman fold protein [Geminicoccaceae bacterium]|nr:TIGR00730 family Rossman fold protein [Geminicoccaceae bacterium]